MEVPHSEDIIPEENRINGKHIMNYAHHLSSEPENYNKKFSKYLSKGLRPEEFSEHCSEVKNKIITSFEKKVKV